VGSGRTAAPDVAHPARRKKLKPARKRDRVQPSRGITSKGHCIQRHAVFAIIAPQIVIDR
jgi:hypothetical protein